MTLETIAVSNKYLPVDDGRKKMKLSRASNSGWRRFSRARRPPRGVPFRRPMGGGIPLNCGAIVETGQDIAGLRSGRRTFSRVLEFPPSSKDRASVSLAVDSAPVHTYKARAFIYLLDYSCSGRGR